MSLYEVEIKNTVLEPIKEQNVGTVDNALDYAVVISSFWQKICELPISTLKKQALVTCEYCEPFLCPSSCDFVSLCEVEFMNTVS